MIHPAVLCVCLAVLSVASNTQYTLQLSPESPAQFPSKHLGTYAPWFPAAEYTPVDGCSVTQVNIIQRHGSRFPTESSGKLIEQTISKLKASNNIRKDLEFGFIADFEYDLGYNDLLPFGARESSDAGQTTARRYHELVQASSEIPFVRSSSCERVVHSAGNWSAGFSRASGIYLESALVISDATGSNDTISNNCCPNSPLSGIQAKYVEKTFTHIAVDLTERLSPQEPILAQDIVFLLGLCGFHSVVISATSPFCSLFDDKTWLQYEYLTDLDKFWDRGWGNPLGKIQGVGYVNELLARLTDSPVQDETTTNRTLDSFPDTFPLGRPIYADFSHDNTIASIFTTLGLFNDSLEMLPLEPTDLFDPQSKRQWKTSRLVPFAGRLVTERYACAGQDQPGVRILVNDAVQAIPGCENWENGLCPMDRFLSSQHYARNNGYGDLEKCAYIPNK